MKQSRFAKLLSILLAVCMVLSMVPGRALAAAADVPIDEAHFPDPVFRQYVLDSIDTGKDQALSASEADLVTELNLNSQTITDLTGLEHFPKLTTLYCAANRLTSLDLGKNPNLVAAYCDRNLNLTSLKLDGCAKLETLDVSTSGLTELQVPTCPSLKNLDCAESSLIRLTLADQPALQELYCYQNPMTELTLGSMPALYKILCADTQITALDLTGCPVLEEAGLMRNHLESLKLPATETLWNLSCPGNALTSLDLSGVPNVTELYCARNQLTELDVSGLSKLVQFSADENHLTHVNLPGAALIRATAPGNVRVVGERSVTLADSFDPAKMTELTGGTLADRTLTFDKGSCKISYRYEIGQVKGAPVLEVFEINLNDGSADVAVNPENFPDDAFRAQVSQQLDKNQDGILDMVERIGGLKIEAPEAGIQNLKGLELLPNVEYLDLTQNQITSIDLSGLANLHYLDVGYNQLTALDMSHNPGLQSLSAEYNRLTALNVSHNPGLQSLDVANNQLSALDVSHNPGLQSLFLGTNQLSALDVTHNPGLQSLDVDNNQLSALDVTHNPGLQTLGVGCNRLKTLDLSQNANLIRLDAYNNLLERLVFHADANPQKVHVDNNRLTHLNAPGTKLIDITASGNKSMMQVSSATLEASFDPAKVTELYGGTLEGHTLTFNEGSHRISYQYEMTRAGDRAITEYFEIYLDDGLSDVALNAENFPDDAFRARVSQQIDKNQDGVLDVIERINGGQIVARGDGIRDFKGLEFLPYVGYLDIAQNQITSIDLSGFADLRYLDVADNQLTRIDLSPIPDLRTLIAENNQLTELDLSSCPDLSGLHINNNQLTELDLSHNSGLYVMYADNNHLTGLDLGSCPNLADLSCTGNAYTVHTRSVKLANLPGKPVADLIRTVSGGSLDEAKGLLTFDDGQNALTYTYYVGKIKGEQTEITFTLNYEEPVGLLIDETSFPDPGFRSYVAGHADANGDGQLTDEELAAVKSLEMASGTVDVIRDLTGLENFPNLEILNITGQPISSLDLSIYSNLLDLRCSGCGLTELKLPTQNKMRALLCSNNRLSTLDLSGAASLFTLEAGSNLFTQLDLSACRSLGVVGVLMNQLWELKLPETDTLFDLDCSGNQLDTLDVTGLPGLAMLTCDRNDLAILDLSKNTKLNAVNADDNNMLYLNLPEAPVHSASAARNVYVFPDTAVGIAMGGAFDPARVRNVKGGTFDAAESEFLFDADSLEITYEYRLGTVDGTEVWNTFTARREGIPPVEPPKPEIEFTDVNPNQWYAENVQWAVENKITEGFPDGSFKPDDDCTRAQIVTFLWRAAGQPEPKMRAAGFTDVKPGAWYEKAVLWAVENKITEGFPDGTFKPNASCNRAQVVTFLYRGAGQPQVSGKNPFGDVKPGWYYDAVLWAVETGVTEGFPDGSFKPDATCTRAQIVTFLYRADAQ